MSVEHPESVEEWRAHFRTLEGTSLREKAIAANTVAFVRLLKEEGYAAREIHMIFTHLARRFVELGERTPGEGLYDLDVVAKDPID